MKNVNAAHARPIVCLDAGHYGKYNRSPAVPAYYESEAMWQLHLYLKEALEAFGIEVRQTRADQTKDLYITDRGRAAKGSDLLLSLHSNAVGSEVNEDVDYVAVYHLQEDTGTDADDRSKALAEQLAPVIAQVMQTRQGSKTLSRIAKTDKNKDGMLNDNYYGVLNGARQVNVPALIVEHSFHTNTRTANWLLEDANLQRLAQAEAAVIAAYFGIAAPEAPAEDSEATTDGEGYEMKMRTLYNGCSGKDVRAMQILLEANGCKGNMDSKKYGSFGSKTEAAVRQYQEKMGLQVDGRCGPATMGSLLGV